MSELLQFMYQGVVNVKHTDLSSFMKIAQALQIKGLATSSQKFPTSPLQTNSSLHSKGSLGNLSDNFPSNNVIETKINTALFSSKADSMPVSSGSGSTSVATSHKRLLDYGSAEPLSIFSKKQIRRTSDSVENDIHNESIDHMSSDEVFMPPIPHISMTESRFDLNNVKREAVEPLLSPGAMRNLVPPPFNFEYNSVFSKGMEYPNELHGNNDFIKTSGGNHMDIPAGNSIFNLCVCVCV